VSAQHLLQALGAVRILHAALLLLGEGWNLQFHPAVAAAGGVVQYQSLLLLLLLLWCLWLG
jgi:hypothetical protein